MFQIKCIDLNEMCILLCTIYFYDELFLRKLRSLVLESCKMGIILN
jgi:hypothetical protein